MFWYKWLEMFWPHIYQQLLLREHLAHWKGFRHIYKLIEFEHDKSFDVLKIG